MSWLAQGLTQSVTGKISQISGQLKDILTESTEDQIDPDTELRVTNDKIKDYEKHVEFLKIESSRWQDEANELNLKCQTYEAQLEQKSNEYRQQLIEKDSQIADLRNQINNLNASIENKATFDTVGLLPSSPGYQKPALMEEFEDLMPSSDLNDYIHLQKEIKRLNEDNYHLSNENKQLLNKLKQYKENFASNEDSDDPNKQNQFESLRNQYETTIENLKQEIFVLKNRIQEDKDKHQEEIIAIQNSYNDKLKSQLREDKDEIESLNLKIEELQSSLNEKQDLLDQKEKQLQNNTIEKIDIIENQTNSDNAWCLNGEEINLDSPNNDLSISISKKDEEISQLKNQIDMFESELEQANSLILKLKTDKSRADSGEVDSSKLKELEEKNKELNREKEKLKSDLESLTEKNAASDQKSIELEKQVDKLELELKQQQQQMNQEKMLQMQEQKQERHEMGKLKTENTELKIKLEEKLGEIKLLGDQINDLNTNINMLKSNDSNLFAELKQKTEQFLAEIDSANSKIHQLTTQNEQLTEQRKQFEFVLDEKTREITHLKSDIQKHLQHIGAQSKAIEKLQEDLRNQASQKSETEEQSSSESAKNTMQESNNELELLRQQYNQIYSYLEQKNQESLSYYNEIQRLNIVISDLNRELLNTKNLNENLTEQYENLVKEFQLEQKMVEDLNQQTNDLNKSLLNVTQAPVSETPSEPDSNQLEKLKAYENEIELLRRSVKELKALNSETEEKYKQVIADLEGKLQQMVNDGNNKIDEFNSKLNEFRGYYENEMYNRNEKFKMDIHNEQLQTDRFKKELERLREHLVEMSDNYTKEAIQAEDREKQLRLALNDAQQLLQQQGSNLETSNKELETKLDQLKSSSQELKQERDKLKEKLKQTEESLTHQHKVTQNLELVLERLQEEKDSQHTLEISKYQQAIKEHAVTIRNLQQEAEKHKGEIEDLKEALENAAEIESQLDKKEELFKQIQAQISTKDTLIESLYKKINEIQKVNDSYIEKEIAKNLIIGYIKVNQPQERRQVIKLVSTLLNFSKTELEQVEASLAANESSKWFGGILNKSPNNKQQPNQSSGDPLNKSFAELLIQYVDRESKPKPTIQFDLNSTSATNKKTDNPLLLKDSILNDDSLSASSIKFFNNNLSSTDPSNTSATVTDNTLVNRTGTTSSSQTQSAINNLASPAVANTFLEQILKN